MSRANEIVARLLEDRYADMPSTGSANDPWRQTTGPLPKMKFAARPGSLEQKKRRKKEEEDEPGKFIPKIKHVQLPKPDRWKYKPKDEPDET